MSITPIQLQLLRDAIASQSITVKRANRDRFKAAENLANRNFLRRTGEVLLVTGEIIPASQKKYHQEILGEVYKISRKGRELVAEITKPVCEECDV